MNFQSNKKDTNLSKEAINTEKPSLARIILHNDDFTPREFVIRMLEMLFFMDRIEASLVTMQAHTEGMAICGTFSWDYAEAKVMQVIDYSKENDFPLRCSTQVAV